MAQVQHKALSYRGRGITSGRDINVELELKQPGHGVVFRLVSDGEPVIVPATAAYVVNTLRNVVLGIPEKNGKNSHVRLCIVEHILAAVSIWGIEDLLITVDGPEMPLADGSAQIWLDMFKNAGIERRAIESTVELGEPIICKKGDRSLLAVPDDAFSITYLMDWDHPQIGKCWRTWTPAMPPEDILHARTFGSLKEHEMLGIAAEVVSFTADGFSQPLRWSDEPVRHKLLDLIGDLALAGINPIKWKARFISIKAGHEMDVEMARRLTKVIEKRS